MDRPLNIQAVLRNRRQKYLKVGVPLGAVAVLFLLLSAWIRPSVDRSNIVTAIVQRGSIEETISASGNVVPASEQAISSPGETRLLAVRRKPGEHVARGESILDLDRSELTLSQDRIQKELALKVNQRTQLKLDMERTLRDLRGQLNIKNLRLQYLQSKSAQSEKLLTLGAISKDQSDQAKLEEHIATIERSELEQSIETSGRSLENQLNSLSTEVSTLEKETADIRRQLELLSCKSDHDGVVTWLNDHIGTSIHRGEIVARVADLSSYKVEASVSDIHASQLSVGMPARIKLNDLTIPGTILAVYPAIENGIAKITLSIADSSNNLLRPNQRVDVFLVRDHRENTMKVKKGAFINGNGAQEVFVLRDDIARKCQVVIGVMSFDEVEVVSGVDAGSEIIISDMSAYKHLSQIKVH